MGSWSGSKTTCVRMLRSTLGPAVRPEKKRGCPRPSGYRWRPCRVTATIVYGFVDRGSLSGVLPDRFEAPRHVEVDFTLSRACNLFCLSKNSTIVRSDNKHGQNLRHDTLVEFHFVLCRLLVVSYTTAPASPVCIGVRFRMFGLLCHMSR